MSDYLEKMDHVTDAADPAYGDTEIQNYTINFGPQHPCLLYTSPSPRDS